MMKRLIDDMSAEDMKRSWGEGVNGADAWFDEVCQPITDSKLFITHREIDADKIKTMDDVRLLFKAIDMRVQPHNSNYSELEHLFKEQE
jgi:hypothetical protein